ncbi:MAG: hypothetical protein K6G56_09480 [Clostridiales bacterium]|nr:hypothetical protein [Clostridiales bacterium]
MEFSTFAALRIRGFSMIEQPFPTPENASYHSNALSIFKTRSRIYKDYEKRPAMQPTVDKISAGCKAPLLAQPPFLRYDHGVKRRGPQISGSGSVTENEKRRVNYEHRIRKQAR